jgi:DNA invertase Pin-like site-specific DNA recombinase
MSKVALYLRVSTGDQTIENQRRDLAAWAERRGHRIVREFVDEGISGAKGRDRRPGFDALCKATVRREVDIIAAWSVDRLGRSLQDLVGFLSEVHGAGVDLYLDKQGIDTTIPTGKAMFQMMGVFAEFERAMISERTIAGLQRVRAAGKRLGRPELGDDMRARIADLAATGASAYRISKTLGCDIKTAAKYAGA